MATAPVKSPLHNFPLTFLKWGSKNHHQQRCRRSPFDSPPPPPPDSEPETTAVESLSPHRPPPITEERETEVVPESDNKQWDLRPRRAANLSAVKTPEYTPKSMRLRGSEVQGGGGGRGGERREKRKFWIALSREEIEEDIYSLTGSKPSRRPRRHPKNVQKQLDNVFPGLWLVGLTSESYRGLDVPPKR